MPYDGIVPLDFSAGAVNLGICAKTVLDACGENGDGRTLRMDDDKALLELIAASPRFAALSLSGYTNIFSPADEEQFSAITIFLPENDICISFRGTDGTLIGWKEDFNMGFALSVPAQVDAVSYLSSAAEYYSGNISITGHSKGGNLAVYSALFSSEVIRRRITAVRNFDGPGFNEGVISGNAFKELAPNIHTYIPQSSVIGMLLEHSEDFTIVSSRSLGIFQHNLYMWEVMGSTFVQVESRTNSSQFIDATLKEWVKNLPVESREKMINGIYAVVSASDSKTLRDLWHGKSTLAMLKAAGSLDDETKSIISDAFRILRTSAKTSISNIEPAFLSQPRSAI